jgi:hypothetical protein
MGHDVFVSHSARDKVVADAVVAALEHGETVERFQDRGTVPETVERFRPWNGSRVRCFDPSDPSGNLVYPASLPVVMLQARTPYARSGTALRGDRSERRTALCADHRY